MASVEVKHNSAQNRFEASESGGQAAYLEYERRGNALALTHTVVPEQMRGRGVGNALVKAALEFAQGAETPVIPECEFVVAYLKRNPQYLDIVEATHRSVLEAHQIGKNEGGMAA
jgi:predicted GNAT family acetyltransferase